MGKIIVKNVVERKPNFLYYVDGQGNVCEAEMQHGGKKKKKVAKKKKISGATTKKTTKKKARK